MASATLIAPAEAPPASSNPDWGTGYACECGHALRVFGGGRHRVHFEPENIRLDQPVMNRVCPACRHGLAGKNQR